MGATQMKVFLSVFLFISLMTITSCGKDINSVSTYNSSGLVTESTIKGNLAIKDKDGKILLEKSDFVSAQEHFDKNHNTYSIMLTTNTTGTTKVSDYTKAMIGQQVFVYLDEKLISSLTIVAQITNSSQVIGGSFSKEEVDKLCSKINNGQ